MQKIYLFIGIMIVCATTIAQPVINDSHMPVIGYSTYLSTPDTLLQVDPAPTDSNFVWDFSSFTAISQSKDSFISLNAVPFTIRFQVPGDVNVVKVQETPDSVAGFGLGEGYEFFSVKTSTYSGFGIGGTLNGLPLALINDPADTLLRFPLEYGNIDTSNSVAELSVAGLIYVRQERQRINEVDGWGILTTPYGTFSTMRVKSSITGFDTIAFDTIAFGINNPLQREYKWIGAEERVPLLEMNTLAVDSLGEIVTSIAYVDSFRNIQPPLSIQDRINAKPLNLYPNPARAFTNIDLPDAGEFKIEIFDISGRLLETTIIRGQALQINLRQFSKGIYPVKVTSKNEVYRGKLVVE